MIRRAKIPATSSEPRDTYHHGDLKRALTEPALGLVSEKGPKGFTLREVARRAGVSAAAPAMSGMLNHAISTGPVSLPHAVAMLDTAYLGHVIVLWSWALNSPTPTTPNRPPSASAPSTAATAKSPSPV